MPLSYRILLFRQYSTISSWLFQPKSTRPIPRIPAGHTGQGKVAALKVEDSLVSPIFPPKPCVIQGVLDIRYGRTRVPLLFRYSMLDKCRGVRTMKDNRLKVEIARLELSDLGRKPSVG